MFDVVQSVFLDEIANIDLNNGYIIRKPVANILDAQALLDCYSNPEVAKYVPDDLIPGDMPTAIDLVEYYRDAAKKGNMAYWSIARKIDNKMIGLIGFCDINHYNKRAEIAYELNPEYWGQGITTLAVKKMCEIFFEQLGIKRIQANVLPENTASLSVLKKAGFIHEGILDSYRFFKGKQRNIIMLGLSSERYSLYQKQQNSLSEVYQMPKKVWSSIPSHEEVVRKFRKIVNA